MRLLRTRNRESAAEIRNSAPRAETVFDFGGNLKSVVGQRAEARLHSFHPNKTSELGLNFTSGKFV